MERAPSRTVFIDIETYSARKTTSPIEVAAIAVDSGTYQVLDSIDIKISFDIKKARLKLLGVNKFSPTLWERFAISERQAATKLSLFLEQNATLARISKRTGNTYFVANVVAHNAEFDLGRLTAWYKRLAMFLPASRRGLCTEQAARWYFQSNQHLVPPRDFKLATLAEYFSLPYPDHTALGDATTCLALARTLAQPMGREKPLPNEQPLRDFFD